MKPIRVAIVGCGQISDLHQMGYRGREDARITAVCDTNKSHARKKAKEWGVDKVYTDYHQVLEDKEIDLVELFTPHHPALPMTSGGLPGWQACLCTEADGLSAAEADEMIDAAIKRG